MSSFAKAPTDQEIQAAADYFSSMKSTPWIQVVETETVSKTHTSVGSICRLRVPGRNDSANELLRCRSIRKPLKRFGTRILDSSPMCLSEVLKKAKRWSPAATRERARAPFAISADLKGLGPVPGIAGRSPSYLVRQLNDMQQGTRNGTWTELMKPVVKSLTDEDMLNFAAYTSSLRS